MHQIEALKGFYSNSSIFRNESYAYLHAVSRKNLKLVGWLLPLMLVTILILVRFLAPRFSDNISDSSRFEQGWWQLYPQQYGIIGIDISRYQGMIRWKEIKEGFPHGAELRFCYVKATEGVTITDPYFFRNWKAAKKEGLKRGAYHFFRTREDPIRQADHFLRLRPYQKGDLPPVVDVEHLDGVSARVVRQRLLSFLQHVERKTGVRPIIYTYASFYDAYLGDSFKDYSLWVAHYFQPNEPRISRDWHFWQFTDKAEIPAITGKVDVNVFRGDSIQWKSWLKEFK